MELLEKKGLTRILSLLRGTESHGKPVDVIHLDLEEAVVVKCPDCETEYEENQRLKHLASIQHQVATTSIETHNPGFGIPEGNLGFRMLQREGWDGRSGLGPGSRGRLFPVKTSLRKHRVGLAEGDSVGARVTHRYESIQAVQKNNIVKKKHPVAKNLKKRRRDWRMEEVSEDQRLREEIGFI